MMIFLKFLSRSVHLIFLSRSVHLIFLSRRVHLIFLSRSVHLIPELDPLFGQLQILTGSVLLAIATYPLQYYYIYTLLHNYITIICFFSDYVDLISDDDRECPPKLSPSPPPVSPLTPADEWYVSVQ